MDVDTVFYRKMVRAFFYLRHSEPMGDVPHRAGLLTAEQADVLVPRLFKVDCHKYGSFNEIGYSCPAIEGYDKRSCLSLIVVFHAGAVGVWTGDAVQLAPTTFAKGVIVGGNPDSYDARAPNDV